MFEFFFKYPPLMYQEGAVTFLSPWSWWVLGGGFGVFALIAFLSYLSARGRSNTVDRWFLGGLRTAILLVMFGILMQPALVLTSVVPQRNFLAIVVDDSRSMSITDDDGTTRGQKLMDVLGADSEIMAALRERFTLRFFRFSSETGRIDGLEQVGFGGNRTGLANALTQVHEELEGVPLSGLVVVSDGGDNSDASMTDALLPLQAATVPVYTVGVGDETLREDVQISRADVPERALVGTSMIVDVVVDARGYAGRTVDLVVEDFGRIVTTESIELPGDGQPRVTPVQMTLDEPGVRELTFRIAPMPGERITQNNERHAVIDLSDRPEKILYFEGEPRFEVGFLRRAVADDENLQLVVLQRTAEDKFLRLNVDDGLELVTGFPSTREELFQYRALILGSVEASFFTRDQLDMLADFVSTRGGSLLMVGGRRAFGEGGYAGTPLEEVLPVQITDAAPGSTTTSRLVFLKATPTPAGLNHATTRLAGDLEASLERWESLPPVSTTNVVTSLKPGATALLMGQVVEGAGGNEDRVVLAHQRYGRGSALALPVQDTWLWQMDQSVPLEDRSHETFWRQLLRSLVSATPDPVEARVDPVSVEAGETATVRARVTDGTYVAVNGATVRATISAPSGATRELPLEWSVTEDGEYTGTFEPVEAGIHEIDVTAQQDTSVLGTARTTARVAPGQGEYFDPHQRRPLLERIATSTGGRYYPVAEAANLVDDIQYTGGGVTVTEERDLWDMPFLFLLLFGLIATEWGVRKRKGLA